MLLLRLETRLALVFEEASSQPSCTIPIAEIRLSSQRKGIGRDRSVGLHPALVECMFLYFLRRQRAPEHCGVKHILRRLHISLRVQSEIGGLVLRRKGQTPEATAAAH